MGKSEIEFVRKYTNAGLAETVKALRDSGGDQFEAVKKLISDEDCERFLWSFRKGDATPEEAQLYNLFRPPRIWQKRTPPQPPDNVKPVPTWFTMETDIQKGIASMSETEILDRFYAFPFTGDTDSFGIEFDDWNWLLVYRMFNEGKPASGFWAIACVSGEEYFTRRENTVLNLEQAGELLLSFRNRTHHWAALDWQMPISAED